MANEMKMVPIKPNLGLSEATVEGVVKIFQTLLADEMTLYVKLRNYHWNVTGPQFHSLHEMFEEQYTQLALTIDKIAERIRAYGVKADGTMTTFIEKSRLEETPGEWPDARQMMMNLIEDQEALVRYLREDIDTVDELDDDGAEDFLTGLLQEHQEMAWMLRTFVEGPAVHE